MSGQGYNALSRLVHRLALKYTAVAEISFDIESAVLKNPGPVADNHVFVSGLARSGTTALMQYLHQTGRFKSLTYQDMPFVLMPNLWKKLSNRQAAGPNQERAHKDGIMIDFDSPEAFEEVFWRVFCGKDYILTDRLKIHRVSAEVSKKFKIYIANVLAGRDSPLQTRYLSKNNSNILRLGYLQKNFPDSFVIIPFRHPLQQSNSLLLQHNNFVNIQSEDKFAFDYMNWLGHYEFGLNQKSFFLGDELLSNAMSKYPKTSINFWLLNWKNYYQYALQKATGNTTFFNYEEFCNNPGQSLVRLFKKIAVDSPGLRPSAFNKQQKPVGGFDNVLLDECLSIYNSIVAKAGE